MTMTNPKVGLVLTGGGARAAYQVGALSAISEIVPDIPTPFKVITGVSAGAINGSYLASAPNGSIHESSMHLMETWSNLTVEDVFKTDTVSFLGIGLRFAKEVGFGSSRKLPQSTHLLNTEPLKDLLSQKINFNILSENIRNGLVSGFAITATNYRSGTAITFYDTHEPIQDWIRSTRISRRTKVEVEHIMASAAIPIFFPPIAVEGSYYGDGCVRLNSPMSPAIHLGADKILAIGVRHPRSNEAVIDLNQQQMTSVALAEVLGVMLNSIFLDSLNSDLERMSRINRTIKLLNEGRVAPLKSPDGLKHIPILTILPSRDLGSLASDQFVNFPKILKHLLKTIGAHDQKGWELLSYLAFEGSYTKLLIELGYQDAMNMKQEIQAFFST